MASSSTWLMLGLNIIRVYVGFAVWDVGLEFRAYSLRFMVYSLGLRV